MSLKEYGDKRHPERTPEPRGQVAAQGTARARFVVQKHSARRLHYDLRLELDGVLKSWAVPKGPSIDPTQKRLAVMVEDHPLEYAAFEGSVPKGEYGAGEVIVWDRGFYVPEPEGQPAEDRARAEAVVREGLSEGKLSFRLFGQKLTGSWALVRLRTGQGKDWLLIKHADEHADPTRDILAEERSVLSGLTVRDMQAGAQPDPTRPRDTSTAALQPSEIPGAAKAPFPDSVSPMLASLTEGPFSHAQWLFEPKLDGVRVIALVQDGRAKLLSRRGLDATPQYPSLAREMANQAVEMVFDGEVVALDERGRPSFQRLQQRINLATEKDVRRAEAEIPIVFYVFDLLYLDGFDLRGVPLERRKALLEATLPGSDKVRYLDHFEGEGDLAFQAAVENGLEGVVAKRRDSRYESGKRSRSWLKVKATASDDFVIGAYSAGLGKRAGTLGALLVGIPKDGKLTYVAHVGTGFDEKMLADLKARLDSLRTHTSPFETMPPLKGPTTWVRPELVAEVKFAQWTRDGHLRAPVFLRLREEKSPAEVRPAGVVSAPKRTQGGELPDDLAREAGDVLEQLEQFRERMVLKIQGEKISLTNLDKPFWPAGPDHPILKKRDLIAYLAKVSPYLLPHLRDRPLTLRRYPDGVFGSHFFQKHWSHPLPRFVATVRLYSEQNDADQDYLLCNNLATLLWLGQIGDLELHTWYSRTNPEPDGRHLPRTYTGSAENIERSLLGHPDFMVFDLDPYIYSGKEAPGGEPELNRRAFARTCDAALWLREVLDELSLSCFVKTSGKTGLHIFVPVLRQFGHDAVRTFCGEVADHLLRQHPDVLTTQWSVANRTGKIFLDYNQNARGKTLASIYSPRAAAEATVSMPLRWKELGKVFPTDFTVVTAPERLKQVGDLWSGILEAKHDLGALLERAA